MLMGYKLVPGSPMRPIQRTPGLGRAEGHSPVSSVLRRTPRRSSAMPADSLEHAKQ